MKLTITSLTINKSPTQTLPVKEYVISVNNIKIPRIKRLTDKKLLVYNAYKIKCSILQYRRSELKTFLQNF